MAVENVFWALITIMGNSGLILLMRGMRSKAFSSGMTTSVITRTPSPLITHCQSIEALELARTSYPALTSACVTTVLIALSSSASSTTPLLIIILLRVRCFCRHWHQDSKDCLPSLCFTFNDTTMIPNDFSH